VFFTYSADLFPGILEKTKAYWGVRKCGEVSSTKPVFLLAGEREPSWLGMSWEPAREGGKTVKKKYTESTKSGQERRGGGGGGERIFFFMIKFGGKDIGRGEDWGEKSFLQKKSGTGRWTYSSGVSR